MKKRLLNQSAFGLIEALVGIAIIAIIGLALSSSMTSGYLTIKQSDVGAAASLLAGNKIEEYASYDPATLSDADDSNETGLIVPNLSGVTFQRVTDVTVDVGDNSVTIDVTVTSEHARVPMSISRSLTVIDS